MQLINALRFSCYEIAAFVGAGGKTTAIFNMAGELLKSKENILSPIGRVIVTTTTHFGKWQANFADYYIQVDSRSDFKRLELNLPKGLILITGKEVNNRLTGLNEYMMEDVYEIAKKYHLPLLIEADGSKRRPLKAPAEHEPAIPEFAETVIVVAGMEGIGKPLTKEWVHRPEIYSKLANIGLNDLISSESIVRELQNKDGGLKNIPPTARNIVLLTQADNDQLQEYGRDIASKLLEEYQSIIVASLGGLNPQNRPERYESPIDRVEIHAVMEKIGGIVLAAGSSSRFGSPKQLLPFNNEPIIRHVIKTALCSQLSPVVVVLGSNAEEIEPAINDLPVRIVINKDWSLGLSASLREGLNSIDEYVGGVIFMQADQPQTSPRLISQLMEAHQKNLASITAPLINGRRGTPVLFDRTIFNQLKKLEGDSGGRTLFQQFPVYWVKWDDPYQNLDIDTPEDYQAFLEHYKDQG